MDSPFLVVIAMKEESQGLFEKDGVQVLYTGLGKVNATYHLTRALTERRALDRPVKAVFNFGTAGSFTFATHSLVECNGFVQRDMDVSALGIPQGVTPFESIPKKITMPQRLSLTTGTCGTGDRFETSKPIVECDVVDMEAYAFAKICWLEKIPFVAVKYITDGSDHNAHNDWQANLPFAAKAFVGAYKDLISLF